MLLSLLSPLTNAFNTLHCSGTHTSTHALIHVTFAGISQINQHRSWNLHLKNVMKNKELLTRTQWTHTEATQVKREDQKWDEARLSLETVSLLIHCRWSGDNDTFTVQSFGQLQSVLRVWNYVWVVSRSGKYALKVYRAVSEGCVITVRAGRGHTVCNWYRKKKKMLFL